jgi:hypothetical protein
MTLVSSCGAFGPGHLLYIVEAPGCWGQIGYHSCLDQIVAWGLLATWHIFVVVALGGAALFMRNEVYSVRPDAADAF